MRLAWGRNSKDDDSHPFHATAPGFVSQGIHRPLTPTGEESAEGVRFLPRGRRREGRDPRGELTRPGPWERFFGRGLSLPPVGQGVIIEPPTQGSCYPIQWVTVP